MMDSTELQSCDNQRFAIEKKKDLDKLIAMFKIINRLKEDASVDNLVTILLDIAELAGGEQGISFNSADSDCIRNKYGYISRLKKKKINKAGLYFEKLYHLKVILSDSPTLSDSETEDLISDLYNLQKKLARILREENEFSNEIQLIKQIKELSYNPVEHDILNIRNFSTERFESIALKNIKEEVTLLKTVLLENGSINDEMYYFARKFIIIGELSLQIFEDKDRTIKKTDVLNVLQNLRDIRNASIHHHINIQHYTENKQKIENIIFELQQNLTKIIKTDGTNTFLNYDSEAIKLLIENSSKLKKILKSSSKQTTKTTTTSTGSAATTNSKNDAQMLNVLKNIVVKTAIEIRKNENLSEASLNKLNEEYNNIKIKLTEIPALYPETLSIDNKEVIINLAHEFEQERNINNEDEKLKTDKNEKKEETKNSETKDTIRNFLKKINIEMTYLRKMEQSREKSEKNECIMDHIVSLMGQYFKGMFDAYGKIIIDNNLISPEQSNTCQDLDACKTAQDATTKELVHNVQDPINRESLNNRVKDNILPEAKELVHNVQDPINRESLNNRVKDNILLEAKELVHNVQVPINRESLNNRVKDNILPEHLYFIFVSTIYKNDYCHDKNVPRSVKMYYDLGVSYCKLNQVDEGIKYFEECIKCIKQTYINEFHLFEIDLNLPEKDQESINVRDKQKLSFICSYDIFYLECIYQLAIHSYNNDEVYELRSKQIAKIILTHTNPEPMKVLADDIYFCPSSIYYDCVCRLYCVFIIYLNKDRRQDQDYKELLEKVESFSKLSDSLDCKSILALAYFNVKKYKQVDELIEFILKHSNDPLTRHFVLEIKITLLIGDRITLPNDFVNQVEKILSLVNNLDKSRYKECMGDEPVAIDLCIIRLKVILLFRKMIEGKIEYDLNIKSELNELEEKFKNIIKNLQENNLLITIFINYTYMSLIYAEFIDGYCNIMSKECSENDFEDMFKKAQNYLKAQKQLGTDNRIDACALASACGCYFSNHEIHIEPRKRINYLNSSLDIVREYNENLKDASAQNLVEDLLTGLGFWHLHLGHKCISSDPDYAVENIRKAIDCLLQIDDEPDTRFNIKFHRDVCLCDGFVLMGVIRRSLYYIQKAQTYNDRNNKLISTEVERLKIPSKENNKLINKQIMDLEKQKRMLEKMKREFDMNN